MFIFIWVARAKHLLADYFFANSAVVSSLSVFHDKQKCFFWSRVIFRIITYVRQQQKLCGFPDFYVNELAELEMGRAGSVLWTYGFLRLETKLAASRQTQRYSCRLSVRRYSVWSRRPIILTLVFLVWLLAGEYLHNIQKHRGHFCPSFSCDFTKPSCHLFRL